MVEILIEVKTGSAAAERLQAYLRDKECLYFAWQMSREDYFGNSTPEDGSFNAMTPYFCTRVPVIRSYVPYFLYSRTLNGIYHFHKENHEQILVLAHYQNTEGEGFMALARFAEGKGEEIACLSNKEETMMKTYTVTIWEMENRSPWTVVFDSREKAEAFKKTAEEMIASAGSDLIVTLDSGKVNDTEYYLNALAEELDVDIPEKAAAEPEDMVPLCVRFAAESRYTATIRVPKKTLPGKNASEMDCQEFIDDVIYKANGEFCDADFGEAEDITGKVIYIEDKADNFLWEDGRLFKDNIEKIKEE